MFGGRKKRAGLVAMIRDQMTMEMRPMMSRGQAYPDLARTAPNENCSSTGCGVISENLNKNAHSI